MKTLIRLEEAALTIASIYLLSYHSLRLPAWVWALLFFAPDISMLGYLFGNKWGAFTYNLFHHRGVAIAVAGWGFWWQQEVLLAAGLLLLAHASFDRIWGYGLKFTSGFKDTHLGSLAKPTPGYKSAA